MAVPEPAQANGAAPVKEPEVVEQTDGPESENGNGVEKAVDGPDVQERIKVDFDLQIGVEEILMDVDPNLSLDYLQKANRLAGKPPPHRTPRDRLVSLHNEHVSRRRQASGDGKAPKMVKKVILALSYAPSSKAIKDLEKVRLLSSPLLSLISLIAIAITIAGRLSGDTRCH